MKGKVFGIVAGISALFMASGLIAGEKTLIKWDSDAAALKKVWVGKGIKYETIDSKLSAVVDSRVDVYSKQFFPVEAGKKYTLSGTFKSLGKTPSKMYFGLRCYDKNKRWISPYHSNVILGSATTLAEACEKGVKTVVIKANKKWKKNLCIAFNAKDDFSDLPNRETIYKITGSSPELVGKTPKWNYNRT